VQADAHLSKWSVSLRQTNAQQAAGYWILATDSYADTLEGNLAVMSDLG